MNTLNKLPHTHRNIFYLTFFLIQSGKIEEVNYEQNAVLAPCMLSLSQRYFQSKRAMRGSLVVVNLAPNKISRLERRILEYFNEDSNHNLGLMVKDARFKHGNASRVTDRAQNYMLLMEDINGLKGALKMWKSLPTWNPLATTIIVLMIPLKTSEQKNQTIKEVFEELRQAGMVYVNAMYQMIADPLKLEVETWFPYHGNNCANAVNDTFKIHVCEIQKGLDERITEFNQDKFPKLPNDLHNCPMKVSSFIWEPFVVGSNSIESGLEIQMLETITEQMEMKLEFHILSSELQTRRITEDNKTWLIYADLTEK